VSSNRNTKLTKTGEGYEGSSLKTFASFERFAIFVWSTL